jgi:ABC-type siderophore export system fused ATPase/permease subunit
VLVFPPKFRPRNILFEERMISLTRNKASYLFYNDQNPAYQNKFYYVDASHLRANGAELFSHDVAQFLKAQH